MLVAQPVALQAFRLYKVMATFVSLQAMGLFLTTSAMQLYIYIYIYMYASKRKLAGIPQLWHA
jgi:hypothetical protein